MFGVWGCLNDVIGKIALMIFFGGGHYQQTWGFQAAKMRGVDETVTDFFVRLKLCRVLLVCKVDSTS